MEKATVGIEYVDKDMIIVLGKRYYTEEYLKLNKDQMHLNGLIEGNKVHVHIAQIESCTQCANNKNAIIDINGRSIDLSKVVMVGEVGGDPSWARYTVFFTGGNQVEIHDERKYADSRELMQMKREDFIKIWKSHNPTP